MDDNSEPTRPPLRQGIRTDPRSLEAHSLTGRQRLLVMALNAIPLLHALAICCTGGLLDLSWPWRLLAVLLVLYVLPAGIARTLLWLCPIRQTVIPLGSKAFFTWWALLNLQIIFCRFPLLDELLRLVPAAYSGWLRLWGSKIGRLVYWSPGTRVLDRSFLEIGDDVIFGAGVKLNPHVMARNEKGQMELLLAPVKVGARAMVGGYSLLTAGSEIPADECSRAYLLSPPFTKWQDGRRVKE